MYYVYILQGSRYYVGMTNDIERRYAEHKEGRVISTSKLGELTLIGWFEFSSKEEAIALEKTIKKSKNTSRYIKATGFVYNKHI